MQNNCVIEKNRPICKGGLKGDGCAYRVHHISVCKDKLWQYCLNTEAIEAAMEASCKTETEEKE